MIHFEKVERDTFNIYWGAFPLLLRVDQLQIFQWKLSFQDFFLKKYSGTIAVSFFFFFFFKKKASKIKNNKNERVIFFWKKKERKLKQRPRMQLSETTFQTHPGCTYFVPLFLGTSFVFHWTVNWDIFRPRPRCTNSGNVHPKGPEGPMASSGCVIFDFPKDTNDHLMKWFFLGVTPVITDKENKFNWTN